MTNPDMTPPMSTPEQRDSFDRGIANMQAALDSSPRSRIPEENQIGGEGMTRLVGFGHYGVSEHIGEDDQARYRVRDTSGNVLIFDPDTRTVHVGHEDPSDSLTLNWTREVTDGSYVTLTDEIPSLFDAAKKEGRLEYPQSRISLILGRLASFGRRSRKHR